MGEKFICVTSDFDLDVKEIIALLNVILCTFITLLFIFVVPSRLPPPSYTWPGFTSEHPHSPVPKNSTYFSSPSCTLH
jgi:hypothetical protein